MKLKLGLSTCPNDTYIYEALIGGLPDSPFQWDVTYADVQTLNEMVLQGELDVAKISCGALSQMGEAYCVLSCGGAVGYGCGPLLLSSRSSVFEPSVCTWLPGKNTTAALLFKHWISCRQQKNASVDYAFFNEVYQNLCLGTQEQGVVIHEHRFTWEKDGLHLIEDLGAFWEKTVHFPVPLGCAVARKTLGSSWIEKVEAEIRSSLAVARSRPVLVSPFIVEKAQIEDLSVIEAHIRMFVTDFSWEMGAAGSSALEKLLALAEGM